MSLVNIAIKKEAIVSFDEMMNVKLTEWLSKKGRSLKMLCDLTQNRYNTFLGIKNGTSKFSNLHTTRIIRLLTVFDKLSVEEVKKKYSEYLTVTNKNSLEPEHIDDLSEDTNFCEYLTKALTDPTSMAIYTMSLGPYGVSESKIKDEFGNHGLKIANGLVEKNILIKSHNKDRCFLPINNQIIEISREKLKELIPVANSFYNPDHKNQDRNFIHLRMESVSRNGLMEIYRIFADATARINDVLADKKHVGEIPYYSFMQMDTFTDHISED